MIRSLPSGTFSRANFSRYWIHLLGVTTLLLFLFSFSTKSTLRDTARQWNQSVGTGYTASLSRARQKSLNPINNATLGFEKILAVSLPERTDHRDGLILAAALSNFTFEFVDGVRGEDVPANALPPGPDGVRDRPGQLGAWRAHMNAIAMIVQQNIGSALIVEDDIDWDVRLRSQLRDIAFGADFVISTLGESVAASPEEFHDYHVPSISPYGDDWDVMWLGHCGMALPDDGPIMVFEDDPSVPQFKNIISFDDNEQKQLRAFPEYSRVVAEQRQGTCSLAYAISQKGARKLLYELGVRLLDDPFDLMLRKFCQGGGGISKHRCVSVMPQVFDHYRRAGPVNADSDIGNVDSDEIRQQGSSFTIRWSTRLNTEKLLDGDTDFIDQYPITESEP